MCMNVDSGGYVCANILCAIIATLLDASQIRKVQMVLLNRSATVNCNAVLASSRTTFLYPHVLCLPSQVVDFTG